MRVPGRSRQGVVLSTCMSNSVLTVTTDQAVCPKEFPFKELETLTLHREGVGQEQMRVDQNLWFLKS